MRAAKTAFVPCARSCTRRRSVRATPPRVSVARVADRLPCRAVLCADELIRQVTIESPERGLLLLRVRDEVRMTISAYQTLYQVRAPSLSCSLLFSCVRPPERMFGVVVVCARVRSRSACARRCRRSRATARFSPRCAIQSFTASQQRAHLPVSAWQIESLEAEKKKLQAQVQDHRALYDSIEKVAHSSQAYLP